MESKNMAAIESIGASSKKEQYEKHEKFVEGFFIALSSKRENKGDES